MLLVGAALIHMKRKAEKHVGWTICLAMLNTGLRSKMQEKEKNNNMLDTASACILNMKLPAACVAESLHGPLMLRLSQE